MPETAESATATDALALANSAPPVPPAVFRESVTRRRSKRERANTGSTLSTTAPPLPEAEFPEATTPRRDTLSSSPTTAAAAAASPVPVPVPAPAPAPTPPAPVHTVRQKARMPNSRPMSSPAEAHV